ncbi:MAG: VCBS repeat-containing protein [Ignavibacteriae bacterium]|nr:VCBS repeat-containing protein [Ignavibacteriota bacterium]
MKKILSVSFILTFFFSTGLIYSQVTFTDQAIALGVNDGGAAQGVVFLDVNNDGFLDIFLANNNTQSKLWLNNSGTSFTDVSASWGLNLMSPTRGTSAADYNNDGFIDIVVGNWQTPIMLFKNTGTAYQDVSSTAGINFMSYGGSVNWIDFNKDGKIDFLFANDGMPPRYNYFFRNDNLTSFTNIAFTIGLIDSSSTLCLAAADYNNDGYPDLFLGTQSYPGSTTTGILYKNNGNGTFSDVTMASGIITTFYTWGAEWGDYNNDGFMDLYLSSTTGYNQLFKNNGNGTFSDVSIAVGLGTDYGQSYSCGWADIDNDGDLDLYVAKGQTYADKMYRNDDSIFTDIAGTCGMGDLRHSSCVSWGDYNNDGFPDLYLNNNGTENRLYKNSGNSNKWVEFKLIGTNSNKSAIGARVRIKTGTKNQIREVEGGSGGKGMNSLPLEFGIGTSTVIDSVIVNWPSGLIQRFANVNPNTIYSLTEGQPLGVNNLNTGIPEKYSLSQNYPNPFNPNTIIRFQIKDTRFVTLKVYDILGKEIAVLVNENKKEGYYETEFRAENIPSGVYFYTLKADSYTETKKMLYIK